MHSGQLEDALTIALEAITVNETTYGPRAPDVAMAYGNLGAIYHSLSRFDEAVEANQRAADIMPIALGAEHPYVIKVLVSLTQVQTMTGRWDAAEANIQKALELGERVLPEDSPEMNRVLRTLAQMRATRDDPESALAFQQRVIDVQERTGVRDGVYVWDLVKLGEFLVTAGRHEEARTRLDEALELQTSRDDDDDVMTGQIHATIAYLWHETGAMKEADASFQRAIALIEPVGNGELYELAEVLEAHGDFLVDAGRRREAVAAYERAGAIYAASGADPADAARITKLVVAATTRPR
jgi:tetratricopeptide (TPR) repeat protein